MAGFFFLPLLGGASCVRPWGTAVASPALFLVLLCGLSLYQSHLALRRFEWGGAGAAIPINTYSVTHLYDTDEHHLLQVTLSKTRLHKAQSKLTEFKLHLSFWKFYFEKMTQTAD